MHKKPPHWFKEKGYLHLSPSLKFGESWQSIVRKIESPKFISKYAFFPLLHTFIVERKYKKGNLEKHVTDKRKHTHRDLNTNKPIRNAKLRPLHYASHFDALVYGYYAFKLNEIYELELSKKHLLNEAIIAYRKIETEKGSEKGKANMHFAKECFDEIKKRSINDDVAVLAIDLKSFFSTLDHSYLKKQWTKLIGEEQLPPDHYNVFKSCTKFKYILKDDLRIGKNSRKGKKKPFDESKLANIRKNKGYRCFFETNEEMRKAITEGNLPIYSNQFYRKVENKNQTKFLNRKINVGIPQGLPISAVLANIYLLEFDNEILDYITDKHNGFYRRYSDDILIVCSKESISEIEKFSYELINKFNIKISAEKTERFIFKNVKYNKDSYKKRLTCFSLDREGNEKISSLTYLGF
ncbi:reverse transcriptase domain-containing protein, partial [Flavobacterium sp. AJR]|uniref:reverse transcriptase domain-containing protein n=1 Tax=Flavobacterium sp. AJR TaxID=1979369 RepID=UPI000B7617BB